MNLPSQSEVMGYFEQYKVPDNIKQHCLTVRKAAVFLAWKLREAGVAIDVELVDRIALIHDMFKIAVLDNLGSSRFRQKGFSPEELAVREELRRKYPGKHEGEIAAEIFNEEYPELAQRLLEECTLSAVFTHWEEMIVHYVDHRIIGTSMVSLAERLDYLSRTYPLAPGYWDEMKQKIQKHERKIFSHLQLTPLEFQDQVNQSHVNQDKVNQDNVNQNQVTHGR